MMRRLVMVGAAIIVLLVIVVWGFTSMSGSRGETIAVAGVGPAPRSGDDAGYTVRYTNSSDQAVTNPQFQTVIRVGEQDFLCYGYQDPTTGDDLLSAEAESRPLTIPARQDMQATIYCKIPADVSLESVQVLQRP
jgi:hypothetical protein